MDVNLSYSFFIDHLTQLVDEHIPIREITIPSKQFICKPWLTKCLAKCVSLLKTDCVK